MIVALSADERATRVKEGDDLCALRGRQAGEPTRYFVRGVLRVALLDGPGDTAWGLWAEIGETDCRQIVAMWSDPEQVHLPPMEAVLANRVPGYPDTTGLPAMLRLTGPTTRPLLAFEGASIHPFAAECTRGVCVHRVMEWLASIR